MFLKCNCGSDTVKVEVRSPSQTGDIQKLNTRAWSRVFLHCSCGQVSEIVLHSHPTLTLEHCEWSEEVPLFGQNQLPRANQGPELLLKG
jgi:hypothetical protein